MQVVMKYGTNFKLHCDFCLCVKKKYNKQIMTKVYDSFMILAPHNSLIYLLAQSSAVIIIIDPRLQKDIDFLRKSNARLETKSDRSRRMLSTTNQLPLIVLAIIKPSSFVTWIASYSLYSLFSF